MPEKKIIAVVGATGAQGGGLARAILEDAEGPFAVRAITRSTGSTKARELAWQGAEVVEADLGDEPSMRKAFDGVHGVYLVTNYWESMSARTELAQAAVGARAARGAGVRHLIWSTLEDTRKHLSLADPRIPVLDGAYTVPHFDAKAEANEFFAKLGVPTTYLHTTFYWEAFIQGFGPVRDETGRLTLTLPMDGAPLPRIAAEDIGRTALEIFRRGEAYIGADVHIAGEHLTGEEFAAAFTKEFGEEVVYRPLGHDEFRALDTPGAQEVGNMFQYYVEAADTFAGARDLAAVRALNPRLQTFRTWLHAHRDAIPRD